MSRKRSAMGDLLALIGATIGVVVILGGLLVVGYFILIAISLSNYGSNK